MKSINQSRTMSSFTALFLALLFANSMVNTTHNLVKADENLIKQECYNADAPTICIQCLESDPRGRSANSIGIATIVVTCLSNHSKTLAANMTQLAGSGAGVAKNASSVYQECSKWYGEANKELTKAFSLLKSGDYDHANHAVSSALEFQLACKEDLGTSIESVPDEVTYEMNVYAWLTLSALRIIDRL